MIGPAGVGKSRLLEELWEARAPRVPHRSFEAPEPLEAPYSYLNPLLELVLEIAREQPLLGRRLLRDDAAVVARIAPRLTELDLLEITQAEALPPTEERRRAKQVLWRVIHRLSRQEPLMFICDDLEKSDLLSLDVLHHVSDQLASAAAGGEPDLKPGSLMLVGARRGRALTLAQQQSVQRITLGPFDDDELRQLVTACSAARLHTVMQHAREHPRRPVGLHRDAPCAGGALLSGTVSAPGARATSSRPRCLVGTDKISAMAWSRSSSRAYQRRQGRCSACAQPVPVPLAGRCRSGRDRPVGGSTARCDRSFGAHGMLVEAMRQRDGYHVATATWLATLGDA